MGLYAYVFAHVATSSPAFLLLALDEAVRNAKWVSPSLVEYLREQGAHTASELNDVEKFNPKSQREHSVVPSASSSEKSSQ